MALKTMPAPSAQPTTNPLDIPLGKGTDIGTLQWEITPPSPADLTGTETFTHLNGASVGNIVGRAPATVADFWKFALSDLKMNNARGYLSEYLVSLALGLEQVKRVEWDAYDLLFGEITIEVKSSAFIQAWPQHTVSSIVFSGLRRKAAPSGGQDGDQGVASRYAAQVYIFSVQTAKRHEDYDPLSLDQWEFFVLPRRVMETTNQDSMRLSTVRRLAGAPINWDALREAVTTAVAR